MTNRFRTIITSCVLLLASTATFAADPMKAVQIYKQDELLDLIKKNQHLQRVKADDCQLVQDIEARATVVKTPAYQFLYGDMLAYAVCFPRDIERGLYYMKLAAEQGLPEGLEQLGRYYHIGKFVQKNEEQAIVYLREAASLGNLKAQIRLVEIFVAGAGNPIDYEAAYRWLYHSAIVDTKQHKYVENLLQQLSERMPPKILRRAKKSYN